MRPFDESGMFRSTEGGMRQLAVKGASVTVLASVLGLAIQIIATVVLARILTPSDFGLVAMVTTFSLVPMNFGLNGFTEAVIQRDTIDHKLVTNLFWICAAAGVLLTITFAAAGSLLAQFYHDHLVAQVAVAVSPSILFTSFAVLHLALLKRAMRFSLVSANDICSRIVSVAVSIIFAIAGWGYWALVAGAVAQPLTACVVAWFMCRWVPGLPRRVKGTATMLRFAMNVYARFGVNYLASNTDNLLVGWRFEAQALGFYKKAYDLFALPAGVFTSSLTTVAVAALSPVKRDPGRFRKHLFGALGVMAFIGMGLSADLTLVGKDLIRLLLGPKWGEAGRIFELFGPGIGAMFLYGTNGWIHLSIGRADRWFRWGIIEFAFTSLLFVLVLPWGPRGIAVAWTASFWLLTIPAFWFAGKPINLGSTAIVSVVWKYIISAIAAGGLSAMLIRYVPLFGPASTAMEALVRIVEVSLVFGILYLGAIILLFRGCAPLYQVAGLMGEIAPWIKVSGTSPASASARTSVHQTSDPLCKPGQAD
jgi:O-antigen/teichoic acid export membrane protein